MEGWRGRERGRESNIMDVHAMKHGDGPSVREIVVDDNDHRGASRGSSEQFTQMRSITQTPHERQAGHVIPRLNHAFQDSNIAKEGGERGRGQNRHTNHANNTV